MKWQKTSDATVCGGAKAKGMHGGKGVDLVAGYSVVEDGFIGHAYVADDIFGKTNRVKVPMESKISNSEQDAFEYAWNCAVAHIEGQS